MDEQDRLDILAEDLNNQINKIFKNSLLNEKQRHEVLKKCLDDFINSNRLDTAKGYSIDFTMTDGVAKTKVCRNKTLEGMVYLR